MWPSSCANQCVYVNVYMYNIYASCTPNSVMFDSSSVRFGYSHIPHTA